MRFFEHQAQARRWSRRLVWLYLAAVVVMVVLSVALLVVLFKFLRAVLRRVSSLFSASAKVA